jgi:O-antigen ligase
MRSHFLQDFKKCLIIAPFPILTLMGYMGLKSTVILPDGVHVFNGLYHPAYLGWYDFVLAYSIVFCLVTGLVKIELKDLFWGAILIYIIVQSWTNTYQLDKQFVVDGTVHFLRFFLLFLYAKYLVIQLGVKKAESILIVLCLLLGANAVLWYSLQFGVENRMAASAMTAPSFGQVMAIFCLIAYHRKYYLLLLFSFIFLFLSFSRTSLLLFLLLLLVKNKKIFSWTVLKYIIIFSIVMGLAIFMLIKYGGDATQVVLTSRFSYEEVASANGRSEIWGSAWQQIISGKIPLFGIGFNTTPHLIQNIRLIAINPEGDSHAIPSFHSIVVEYLLGMGILSFCIFAYFLKRIWQTFSQQCYPAFFIFCFFFISQSLDFTFYQPKEVILWSLMLGMAEGQWRCSIERNQETEGLNQ